MEENQKIEIQVGDRVTYKGYGESKIVMMISNEFFTMNNTEIQKIERIGSNGWYTVYEKEEKKDLLTADEKAILINLKKITSEIYYIQRIGNDLFFLDKNDSKNIAKILNTKMFKGLNPCNKYTLEELGLED